MSKILYESRRFTPDAEAVLAQAGEICDEYARQGYGLTLRQLYYQFIARDLFPDSRRDMLMGTKNTEKNYKWLGTVISDGRIAGRLDWAHISDRTRSPQGGDSGWDSPRQIIESSADQYGISHWDGQPEYVEVWVEKEALADVISRTSNRWDVTSFACKGYTSQSSMHTAARRLRSMEMTGRKVTVIHLGDHDPSGMDMTRDIQDRLAMFRSAASVDRIALNMDQIEELNPPPSPAKITDPRARDYIEMYGDQSWELDAIDPAALDTLVEGAILEHLDLTLRQERLDQEEREKVQLSAIADNYDLLLEYLRSENLLDEDDDE
jgi:hypothetical protein